MNSRGIIVNQLLRKICQNTRIDRSEKTHILSYFTQWIRLNAVNIWRWYLSTSNKNHNRITNRSKQQPLKKLKFFVIYFYLKENFLFCVVNWEYEYPATSAHSNVIDMASLFTSAMKIFYREIFLIYIVVFLKILSHRKKFYIKTVNLAETCLAFCKNC